MKKLYPILAILIFFPSMLLAYDFTDINYRYVRFQKGDSIWRLAGKDRQKAEMLALINGVDCRIMKAGQMVRVPANDNEWLRVFAFWKIMNMEYRPEYKQQKRLIEISLSEQLIRCFEYGKVVKIFPVSTGRHKSFLKTKTGKFVVLEKDRNHESNLFFDKQGNPAPMSFALRLTWSGTWIHAGYLPGKPMSHGCIRMLRKDAKWLFGWSEVLMPAIVKN